MRFPVGDLSAYVNQLCVKEWQQLWNQCTSNKLYSVQPVVDRSVSSSLGRYDSVLVNRLRIGHTRLTNSGAASCTTSSTVSSEAVAGVLTFFLFTGAVHFFIDNCFLRLLDFLLGFCWTFLLSLFLFQCVLVR